jgi:hypothetical protein
LTTEGEACLYSSGHREAEQHVRADQPVGDLRVNLPLAFGTDQIAPLLPRVFENIFPG